MSRAPQFRNPQYRANHRRLHRERGRAADQVCVRCPASALDWAQLHGEDGSDPWADFVPMCRKCHVIYDRAGRPGHPQTAETRDKVSASKSGWNPSLVTRTRMSASAKVRAVSRKRDHLGHWEPGG